MTGMKGPLGSGAFAEPRRSEDERMRIAMAERDADPCTELRNVYEGSCAQSWVCEKKNKTQQALETGLTLTHLD